MQNFQVSFSPLIDSICPDEVSHMIPNLDSRFDSSKKRLGPIFRILFLLRPISLVLSLQYINIVYTWR